MKRILLLSALALFTVALAAQTPQHITKRLNLMEKNIALTPEERAALEPLMVKYYKDVAGIDSEEAKKPYYNVFVKEVFKVIGQRRWQQSVALEYNRRIVIPESVQKRAAIISKELSLQTEQTLQIEEIMALYNYDVSDLKARDATQQSINDRYKVFLDDMSAVVGGRDRLQRGLQAIKETETQ